MLSPPAFQQTPRQETDGRMKQYLVLMALLAALTGCKETYRVEPLLLEPPEIVQNTLGKYKDSPQIKTAGKLAAEFLKAREDGECDKAFDMLSQRYRTRFAKTAGTDQEARKAFCDGYRVEKDLLVQGDWTTVLLGDAPHYITSAPTELPLKHKTSERIFYVVQKDGSYVVFLLVQEGEKVGLEPL
jgi:hypothetical protein